ncbi:MAG: phosphoribosylglycinamide formyltransferase [Rhodospirillales bacterium]
MARLKCGVLISGRGSNLQALIDAAADPDYPAEIALVISNKSDAGGLERARKAGIATEVVLRRDFDDREDFDAAISKTLQTAGVQLVCLAGFMWLLSEGFVNTWRDRLVNIHPSLLPAFKGLNVQAQAIETGARFSGATVHFVRPELDAGPIIVQAVVPVLPDDDADTLSARILEQEHVLYPAAVRWIAEGRVRVSNEVVTVADADFSAQPVILPSVED